MKWQDKRKVEIDLLFSILTRTYSITKENMLSKSRKREFVTARKIFINILAEKFVADRYTHNDITSIINRNRLSFIHHRKEHTNFYATDKSYKKEYDLIKEEFKEESEALTKKNTEELKKDINT